jgi:hypothetical protein
MDQAKDLAARSRFRIRLTIPGVLIALLGLGVAVTGWSGLASYEIAFGSESRGNLPHEIRTFPSGRERVQRLTATRPRRCTNKQTVRADVDGDGLSDLVFHDWIKGAAVLGVCTGDGQIDTRPGAGQAELLRIIDVQPDGRDEVLFGSTSVSARYFQVAVFRRGKLRRVLRPQGKPLTLVKGIEVGASGATDRRTGKAFGCKDMTCGKNKEVVQASAWRRSSGRFQWRREAFSIRGASAKRVLVESGRKRGRGNAFDVARSLVVRCRRTAGD